MFLKVIKVNQLKHIKIIEPKFENYSGELGIVVFKNGVSVEKWPWHIQQRLSAAMRVAVIEDDGTVVKAGPAEEMLRRTREGATVVRPLREFTEKDRLKEMLKDADVGTPPSELYTREHLEEIARTRKRAGLTEIAKLWNIRATSIPDLIENILEAQTKFEEAAGGREKVVYKRYENLTPGTNAEEVMAQKDDLKEDPKEKPAKKVVKKAEAKPVVPDAEPVGDFPVKTKPDVHEAALTGDMSAAINAGE